MHDAMPIAEKKIGPFLLQHQAQFGLNPFRNHVQQKNMLPGAIFKQSKK
jgi:hypothetical protein